MAENNDFGVGYAVGRGENGYGNGCGFGGFGGDWLAILVILALLGGNGGWGFGGNGGNNMLGYELGRVATTNDVASGFSTSEIMSDLNDILLGQQAGFASVQQTLCQGFNGINMAIAQQGYNTQAGFYNISRELSDCCCELKETSNRNTQRLLDYFTCKENQDLRDKLQLAQWRESQAAQNAYLVDQLRPTAKPAYLTCSPFEGAYGYNYGRNNWCCGNG